MNIGSRMGGALLIACSLLASGVAAGHPPGDHPPPPPRIIVGWDHGYWHHGWYGPRFGWWWVVGPSWYFYDAPYYGPWEPRRRTRVIVEEVPRRAGPPPAASWYWCNDPRGYYPYVAQCPGGWTAVPATPPDAPRP